MSLPEPMKSKKGTLVRERENRVTIQKFAQEYSNICYTCQARSIVKKEQFIGHREAKDSWVLKR